VLPIPTTSLQDVVLLLLEALLAFVRPRRFGKALMAPIKLRTQPRNYREPAVLFVMRKNIAYVGEQFWDGADLVMEVVSPDDPQRDYIGKRRDYAAAGVSEYWIVDPMKKTITVLKLMRGKYQTHGVLKRGEITTSALLKRASNRIRPSVLRQARYDRIAGVEHREESSNGVKLYRSRCSKA